MSPKTTRRRCDPRQTTAASKFTLDAEGLLDLLSDAPLPTIIVVGCRLVERRVA